LPSDQLSARSWNKSLQMDSEAGREEGTLLLSIASVFLLPIECKPKLMLIHNIDPSRTPVEIINEVLLSIQNDEDELVMRVEKLIRVLKNHERLKYTYPPDPLFRGYLLFSFFDSNLFPAL